jgi:hypothetical protein
MHRDVWRALQRWRWGCEAVRVEGVMEARAHRRRSSGGLLLGRALARWNRRRQWQAWEVLKAGLTGARDRERGRVLLQRCLGRWRGVALARAWAAWRAHAQVACVVQGHRRARTVVLAAAVARWGRQRLWAAFRAWKGAVAAVRRRQREAEEGRAKKLGLAVVSRVVSTRGRKDVERAWRRWHGSTCEAEGERRGVARLMPRVEALEEGLRRKRMQLRAVGPGLRAAVLGMLALRAQLRGAREAALGLREAVAKELEEMGWVHRGRAWWISLAKG